MKNTSIWRLLALTAGIMMLAVLSGCNKLSDPDRKGSRIMVDVRSGMYYTKADCGPQLVDVIKSESGDMVLEEYVSDFGKQADASTKGAIINGGNLTARTINIEGWLQGEPNDHFIDGETITYGGSSWSIDNDYYWRDGVATSFWSYVTPTTGTLENIGWPSDSGTTNELTFDYSLPAAGGSNDAANLQDFLFAYNEETRDIDESTQELVAGQDEFFNIKLHHPLSAVKFDIASLNGSTSTSAWDYVHVTKIELLNVATSGSFTATGSPTNLTFSCTPSSDKANYAQSQNVSRAAIEGGMFTGADSDYVFFMIPQDLTGVKVKVTFQKRAKSGEPLQTVTRTAALTGSWDCGKYYTYKISAWINVLGEELHFVNPTDQDGKAVSGDVAFDSRSEITTAQYVKSVNFSGVKYIKMSWTQYFKKPEDATVANLYIYDPTQPTHNTKNLTQEAGDRSDYISGMYNAKNDSTIGDKKTTPAEWVFKLNGEFNAVAICVEFLNPNGGGNSCQWILKNVTNIVFEILELMPDSEEE